MQEESLIHFKDLSPSFADRVAVPVGDREEDDGSELGLEVETEANREARDGEGLALDLDDRVVERRLGRVAVVQKASS